MIGREGMPGILPLLHHRSTNRSNWPIIYAFFRFRKWLKKVRNQEWKCQCNQNEPEVDEKVRALAREILNDWEAVIAFVDHPDLPPTNNDAERTLRQVVIARLNSFGTRTREGSNFYTASLSVIETCLRRGVDPWTYICQLIIAARKGLPHPPMPPPLARTT
jgi:hypothetical protein